MKEKFVNPDECKTGTEIVVTDVMLIVIRQGKSETCSAHLSQNKLHVIQFIYAYLRYTFVFGAK